ncbi:hypothetical protein AKJ16_DCAP05618 [Drosera capensis]
MIDKNSQPGTCTVEFRMKIEWSFWCHCGQILNLALPIKGACRSQKLKKLHPLCGYSYCKLQEKKQWQIVSQLMESGQESKTVSAFLLLLLLLGSNQNPITHQNKPQQPTPLSTSPYFYS